jgi:hypothetical protein
MKAVKACDGAPCTWPRVHKAFSQKRGPQPKRNPLAAENEKLRRQNQRLQEELEKAHIIIDVQKKVAKLLGHPIGEPEKS